MKSYKPFNLTQNTSSYVGTDHGIHFDRTAAPSSKYRADVAERYPDVILSKAAKKWLHQK
ncbi:hypothetical protein UFOVP1437_41 [uncultured Caudovirales phage]|uniref:Uncharacterized protein n=1 Tax=uncultured Caudovirales phage TaxID=2100421 RepID=A0A6J7XB57_9CAUD|nr:hypothetical protein UFOVP1437_41 [uncultured Caudovirales phage]CAB5228129.1 hypothetical protein UFOVP1531_23 [uncultured Caudovirales phage]